MLLKTAVQHNIGRTAAAEFKKAVGHTEAQAASKGIEQELKALDFAFKDQKLRERRLNSRIAAKYALDAIGLEPKDKRRKKVQEIMQKMAWLRHEAGIKGRMDLTSFSNQRTRLLVALAREIGEARLLAFTKRYDQVLRKLAGKA